MNKDNLVEAFPLCWPPGKPRTQLRDHTNLQASFAKSIDYIRREVRLLGGKQLVISTNMPLRRDGLPYAGAAEPADSGVAVYFIYKDNQMCFACDRWRKIAQNTQAIAKTIEALRGIARWGTGDMMQAAFTGFQALPAPAGGLPWHVVLEIDTQFPYTLEDCESQYRRLRSLCHPDKPGGSNEKFHALQRAIEQARQELKR